MTIQPFAAGSYVSDRTTASLIGLKSRLDALTTQLATGRTAETYGGLGSTRTTSLSTHATISALDGYTAAIAGATTRVTLATASLTQVKTLGDKMRSSLLTDLQSTTAAGLGTSATLARSSLDAAVDALNQQAAGQYLFGGRASEAAPVVSTELMLNGDRTAGLAGLKDLIAELKTADGADGIGRLQPPTRSGAAVTLTENADAETRANFGFTIADAVSSRPGSIAAGLSGTGDPAGGAPGFASYTPPPADGDRFRAAVTLTDGSQRVIDLTARNPATGTEGSFAIDPASAANTAANLKAAVGNLPIASLQSSGKPPVTLDFSAAPAPRTLSLTVDAASPPAAGDTVTLTLALHDGTTKTVTLTATSDPKSTAPGVFLIDTTDADAAARAAKTAENMKAALIASLTAAAKTELAASSATRAAQNFFDGSLSPGLAPRRVATDGHGYAETAQAKTVIWYRGDDAATDPRATATVQVGANRSVAIGARANEAPIRANLAAFAALAADSFTDSSGTRDVARFQAAAERAQALVTPEAGRASLADIAGAFGIAAGSMADAKTQAQATKAALQDAVDGVETVSSEEVAAKLLSLQTQLQASYQVTAMLSKLSLVNYIS